MEETNMRQTKKWLAGLLCVVLLIGLLPTAAFAADSAPAGAVTRAQLAELIQKHTSFGLSGKTSSSASKFTDVDDCTDAQKNAIGVLVDEGILNGGADGTFGADEAATRGIAAIVIWRAMGSPTGDTSKAPFLNDVKSGVNEMYLTPVSNLFASGVLNNSDIDGDQFKPDDPVTEYLLQQWMGRYDATLEGNLTRAQMVTIIQQHQSFGLSGLTSDSAKNFKDVDGCTAEQKNAIGVLFDKGIVRGNGPDVYGPDTAITRGVAALVIWNAAGKPTKTASGLPFKDIKEADWWYPAISNLYAMGVLDNTDVIDSDQFKPDDPIPETTLQKWLAAYDQSQGIGGTEPTVTTTTNPDGSISATVTFPQGAGAATVTIPADVDYGMVAKHAQTGEIVKLSVPTEGGMMVKLDGSAELVLVHNAKDFTDTEGHWAKDAIDFSTAHELFGGTDTTKALFSPDAPMTLSLIHI